MAHWFPFFVFPATLGLCVCAFITFDRILRQQYSLHHFQWVKDGKAIGFFWLPKGSSSWTGSFARSRMLFGWAFCRPAWAEGGEYAPLFRRLRISLFGFWLGCVTFLVYFVILVMEK
jgi:hypothetical protein